MSALCPDRVEMTEKSRVKKRVNSWFCRIKRKGIDIARSFDNQIDAEIWEKSVIREIDVGTFVREIWASGHGEVKLQKAAEKVAKESPPPPVRDMTFKQALQRYVENVTIKKKGAAKEAEKISLLQRTTLATRPLNDLDSADFAAWRDKRLSEGSAPATVKQNLSIISHLFKTARREWGLKDLVNPILDVAKPKVNNERSLRLSALEEKYLLDAIDNPGDGAGNRANKYIGPMVRFALETAMRQGEMLALDWRYVDIDNKIATLLDTKNSDKAVKVPLSPAAINVLKSLQGQDIRKIKGAVFVSTAIAIKQSWVRAIVRAQRNYISDCEKDGKHPDPDFLTDFRFHDLRHEATSRLFETGLDMMEVASITRHKDLRMLKRYTHLKAEDLAKKLERLSQKT